MTSNSFTNVPYTSWLENALHELIKLPVKGLCIIATTNNGDLYNNYYNVSMADKLVMAGLIQQDATLDALAANGVIEYADEEDEIDGTEED